MEGKLWNIGIRVADVEKEVAYFKALGAVLRIEEAVTEAGHFEYALLEFGGTRLFLTPETVFETRCRNRFATNSPTLFWR